MGQTRSPRSSSAVSERTARRRREIVAAAEEQFRTHGFGDVTMARLARSVGITAPALYRHFPNKQAILEAALDDGLTALERCITSSGAAVPAELARVALQHRALGVLWRREARHLSPEQHRNCRLRVSRIVERTAARLPRTDHDVRRLRALALLAVANSPSVHRLSLPPERFAELLAELGQRVVEVEVTTLGPRPPRRTAVELHDPPLTQQRISRRERLLTAAIDVIAERGYRVATMEDIGGEAGIAGSSIYNHFPTKAALLNAALERGGVWLHTDMARILEHHHAPDAALDALVHSYTRFAFDHAAMFDILVVEAQLLRSAEHREALASQHLYVREWIELHQRAHPSLSAAEAGVTVHAALTIVNDLARTPGMRDRPGAADAVVELARHVLRGGGAPDTGDAHAAAS